MEHGSLMQVKVLQNAPLGAFCNTFDLHLAIIGLENKFLVYLRVAILDRFYFTKTTPPHLTLSQKIINENKEAFTNSEIGLNKQPCLISS